MPRERTPASRPRCLPHHRVRPLCVRGGRVHRHETEGHHAAEVRDIRPLGATTRVTLKVEGQSELIEAEVVKDHDSLTGLARGETLFFRPKVWQKLPAI